MNFGKAQTTWRKSQRAWSQPWTAGWTATGWWTTRTRRAWYDWLGSPSRPEDMYSPYRFKEENVQAPHWHTNSSYTTDSSTFGHNYCYWQKRKRRRRAKARKALLHQSTSHLGIQLFFLLRYRFFSRKMQTKKTFLSAFPELFCPHFTLLSANQRKARLPKMTNSMEIYTGCRKKRHLDRKRHQSLL